MIYINNTYIFIIDGLGIGKCPNSQLLKSSNSNTLNSLKLTNALKIPTLQHLGLGNIKKVNAIDFEPFPIGSYGKVFSEIESKNKFAVIQEIFGIEKGKIPQYNPIGKFSEDFISFLKENEIKTVLNKTMNMNDAIVAGEKVSVAKKRPILFSTGVSDLNLAVNVKNFDIKEIITMFDKLIKICKDSDYKFIEYRLLFFKKNNPDSAIFNILKSSKRIIIPADLNLADSVFIGSAFQKAFNFNSAVEVIPLLTDVKSFEFFRSAIRKKQFENQKIFINFKNLYKNISVKNNIPAGITSINAIDRYIHETLSMIDDADKIVVLSTVGCDFNKGKKVTTKEAVPFIYYYKGIKSKYLGNIVASKVFELIDWLGGIFFE